MGRPGEWAWDRWGGAWDRLGGGGSFISECGWGDRDWVLSHKFFFTCAFDFSSLMPSVSFFLVTRT